MHRKTVKDKVRDKIIESKEHSFLRKEFKEFGSSTSISRVLNTLVQEKEVLRIGKGIYVKSKKSVVTGNIIPQITLYEATLEIFKKLGIVVNESKSRLEYNLGHSTQIPMDNKINVGKRHITRKIHFGKAEILYERS